jgi:hypothetical protein
VLGRNIMENNYLEQIKKYLGQGYKFSSYLLINKNTARQTIRITLDNNLENVNLGICPLDEYAEVDKFMNAGF